MRKCLLGTLAVGLVLSIPALSQADEQADLRAVIDKAVKARGGAERLTKYSAESWKGKGKFYGMGEGIDYSGEWIVNGSKQARVTIDVEVMGMAIKQVIISNGDKGWIKVSVGGNDMVMEMPKEMIDETQEQFHANAVISLHPFARGAKGYDLSPLGEVKVGDRPAVGIRISSKGHRDVSMYFDKETHLALKAEFRVVNLEGGGGEVTQEMLMQNYKDYEGVKEASKVVINRDGKLFVDGEMTEYKHLEKVDEALFDKP